MRAYDLSDPVDQQVARDQILERGPTQPSDEMMLDIVRVLPRLGDPLTVDVASKLSIPPPLAFEHLLALEARGVVGAARYRDGYRWTLLRDPRRDRRGR